MPDRMNNERKSSLLMTYLKPVKQEIFTAENGRYAPFRRALPRIAAYFPFSAVKK
jgi:hypothetical protein